MDASDPPQTKWTSAKAWPRLGLWRGLLLLAALDALAWGLVWVLQPGELCQRLGMEARHDAWAWQLRVPRDDPPSGIPAPRDAPGLWQLLAGLSLVEAAFLALAAWRPRSLGGLAVAPLIGHLLGAALWLWALGTTATFPPERIPFPDRNVLWALAGHDAVWVPILVAFLLARWRRAKPQAAGRHGMENAVRVQ